MLKSNILELCSHLPSEKILNIHNVVTFINPVFDKNHNHCHYWHF